MRTFARVRDHGVRLACNDGNFGAVSAAGYTAFGGEVLVGHESLGESEAVKSQARVRVRPV